MKQSTRIIVKNFVVALTLAVAAAATWSVTQSSAPAVEAVTAQVHHG